MLMKYSSQLWRIWLPPFLYFFDHIEPSLMPSAGKISVEPDINYALHLGDRNNPGSHDEDIRVIVFAAGLGGEIIMA